VKARVASGHERALAIGALKASWGDPIIVRGRDWPFDSCMVLIVGRTLGVAAVSFAEWPIAELVAIEAFVRGRGIGSILMAGVIDACEGCRTLRLATTNDNLSAIGFYEHRGFQLTSVRPGAVTAARARKPSIPLIGENGIEIRDEIDLELALGPSA
jgi:GNAT superfamily N-acetyltransferase